LVLSRTADLDASQFNKRKMDGLWTRGLLIRRRIADGDLAFFTTWCPAGNKPSKRGRGQGHRWGDRGQFETAKNEFGLDSQRERSWHGCIATYLW